MRFLCHTQQKYREDKTTPLDFSGRGRPARRKSLRSNNLRQLQIILQKLLHFVLMPIDKSADICIIET